MSWDITESTSKNLFIIGHIADVTYALVIQVVHFLCGIYLKFI
jgi:hypothetical protein